MAKRAIDLSDEKDCELVPLPVLLVSTESSLESSLGSPAKSLAMSLEKECELVILPVLLPSIESFKKSVTYVSVRYKYNSVVCHTE